jgi:hypothetical protein
MHTVKLTGRPLLKAGKEYGLEVESITILDQKTDEEMENDERASFWYSLTLEELAARQGVTPADDLEAISAMAHGRRPSRTLSAYSTGAAGAAQTG